MPTPATFASLCADLLRSGHRVRFRAAGPSMAPAILDGDLVTVAPVDAADVRPGDVILYAALRGLTAHRVVECGSPGEPVSYRTRGDAPGSPEEQVRTNQLLGRLEGRSVGRRSLARWWAGWARRLNRTAELTRSSVIAITHRRP